MGDTADRTENRSPGDGRDESPAERYDRNWSEVLQDQRVLQTGTQILTEFLLALAFQPALATVSLLVVGVVAFVFVVVVGLPASIISAILLGALIIVVWLVVPAIIHAVRRGKEDV
ncbi:MAG: DUF6328 family protein [Microbacterium sp.]|uniref:DUF6328 family protein n=1 Tax=Microbacterium sp. TaxID=51671 RepID=UPI003A83FCAA